MSGPQPSIALEGHCAAVNDDTLYVLSPAGLQSLPLKQNATWSEETNGESITGPACVTAGDGSDAALYVVGGSADDDSYSGLQRYYFGNKTWETLSLPSNNMQARTNHSAAYLKDSQAILVYAGSQPDAPSVYSSQTFLIHTAPPYNIEAFTSEAPPLNMPIMDSWNSSHAVMVGGSPSNTGVYLFNPQQGWTPLETNLTDPIDTTTRGTLIDGSDGSKVLEIYNVNTSPNTVSQIVLLDAQGQTAQSGQTIGSNSSSRKRKRDLSLSNWPSYNSSNAPTATRSDCAVVQGPSGIAAMSGGSSDLPVALFNSGDNSWVDVDQYFNSKEQQPLQPSSTSGGPSAGTATSSSRPSESLEPAGAGMTTHQKMLRTLGITLGVLCGIAVIFILVLLFLRWRKMRRRKMEGYIDEKDEKPGNRLSFADRGASFMKEAGGSVNNLLPPGKSRFSNSNGGSHSSLAIITGKFGGKGGSNLAHHQNGSFDSTTNLVDKPNGSARNGEPLEMMDIGEKRLPVPVPARKPVARTAQGPPVITYDSEKELTVDDHDRSRSSGWSKYFATSGPTGPNGISHLPAAYVKSQTSSGVTSGSEYSSRLPSHPSWIPSSVLVPPLDIDFSKTLDGQRLSHVTRGSPAFNDSSEDLMKRGSTMEAAEGQSGLIVDSHSLDRRSQISGYSLSTNKRTTVGSTLSSNVTSDYYNQSGDTPWTPVSFKDHVLGSSRPNSAGRPTSSNYTNSGVYEPRLPSWRGKNGGNGGFFPGAGTSYKPSIPINSAKAASKLGVSQSSADWPAESMKPPGLVISRPAEERDSTITVFPRGVNSAYYAEREGKATGWAEQKGLSSDMSWVNLGLGQNRI